MTAAAPADRVFGHQKKKSGEARLHRPKSFARRPLLPGAGPVRTIMMCGRGGTGRRATLRSLWPKGRGSSSLLDRTIQSCGTSKIGIHLELPRGGRRYRRRFQLLLSRLSPTIEMSPLRRATVSPPPAATCLHRLRGEAGAAICPQAPSPAPARDRWFRALPAQQRSKRQRCG